MSDITDDRPTGPAAGPNAADVHVDDLVAPYALGALEPEEGGLVTRHVRICPRCARLIAQARRAAAHLPFLSPAAVPGPQVKLALFARIAQAEQAAGTLLVARPELSPAVPTPTLPASGLRRGRPRVAPDLGTPTLGRTWPWLARPQRADRPAATGGRPGGWPILAAPLATVPLVLALTLVGGWAMSLHGKLDDRTTQVNQLQNRLVTLDGLLATKNETVYDLAAGPAAPKAAGQIFIDPAKTEATMMVWRLSNASPSVPYQVWVEKDGKLVRAGELKVDERGTGSTMLKLDQPFAQYKSVHVRAQRLTLDAGNSPSTADVDALSTDIAQALGSAGDTAAASGQ